MAVTSSASCWVLQGQRCQLDQAWNRFLPIPRRIAASLQSYQQPLQVQLSPLNCCRQKASTRQQRTDASRGTESSAVVLLLLQAAGEWQQHTRSPSAPTSGKPVLCRWRSAGRFSCCAFPSAAGNTGSSSHRRHLSAYWWQRWDQCGRVCVCCWELATQRAATLSYLSQSGQQPRPGQLLGTHAPCRQLEAASPLWSRAATTSKKAWAWRPLLVIPASAGCHPERWVKSTTTSTQAQAVGPVL